MTTNPDTAAMSHLFCWVVNHEAWEQAVIFVDTTNEGALAKAEAFILEESNEYRDHDEFPDDRDWIDVCLSEGWEATMASIHHS